MTDETESTRLAHSIEAAAKRLFMSRAQVYNLIRDGKIRRYKVGSRTYIPETELLRFMEAQLAETAAQDAA